MGIAAAVRRLDTATDDGTIDELGARFGLRLLGIFGSATALLDAGPDDDGAASVAAGPHDVDLAVAFAGTPDVLGLIGALTDLLGVDEIDLLVLDGADSVVRSEALCGIGLFESEPGAWAEAQIAAIAERWDTAWMRRLDLEVLGS
jgi:predicted nucleotidyltransferase